MNRIFHFVLSEEMYNDIRNLSITLDMSISGLIKYIIQTCYVFLEEKHFIGMEKEFDMQVEWSKHIQVYFTNSTTRFYNLLKALHHNLDTYSMAQILRFTIQYFLDGVARHGSIDAFLDTLEYKDELWRNFVKNHNTIRRDKRRKPLQQLCCNGRDLSHQYVMNYTYNFQLLSTRPLLE